MALLVPGAFRSPSAFMFSNIFWEWSGKTVVFDPNVVYLVSCRLNKQTDRDVFLVLVTKRVFLNHFCILVRRIHNPVFLLALYALASCVYVEDPCEPSMSCVFCVGKNAKFLADTVTVLQGESFLH